MKLTIEILEEDLKATGFIPALMPLLEYKAEQEGVITPVKGTKRVQRQKPVKAEAPAPAEEPAPEPKQEAEKVKPAEAKEKPAEPAEVKQDTNTPAEAEKPAEEATEPQAEAEAPAPAEDSNKVNNSNEVSTRIQQDSKDDHDEKVALMKALKDFCLNNKEAVPVVKEAMHKREVKNASSATNAQLKEILMEVGAC